MVADWQYDKYASGFSCEPHAVTYFLIHLFCLFICWKQQT